MSADLHLHTPGTKVWNNYFATDVPPDFLPKAEDRERIDRYFVELVNSHPCDVIGLTDYFSIENFRRFKTLLEGTEKTLLPNVEFRIPNDVGQGYINLHLLFSENVEPDHIGEILNGLPCNHRSARILRQVPDHELTSITIKVDDIIATLIKEFGTDYRHSVLVGVPFRSDGMFDPGMRNGQSDRDESHALSILEHVDFFFGNGTDQRIIDQIDWERLQPQKGRGAQSNADYLRLVAKRSKFPRPIFHGSDAHSFKGVEEFISSEIRTWLRGKHSFTAVHQSTIEPETRCRIDAANPGKKDPRYLIESISFTSDDVFPKKVTFNPGLNAVIGPRSSGKSTLLAHVANTIDSNATLEAQKRAQPEKPEKDHGPAEGISWSEQSETVSATVTWRDQDVEARTNQTERRVFYIPQNYLFRISSSDALGNLLNRQIEASPLLSQVRQTIDREYSNKRSEILELSTQAFSLAKRLETLEDTLDSLGDAEEIESSLARASKNYEHLSKQLNSETALAATQMMEFEKQVEEANSTLIASSNRLPLPNADELTRKILDYAVPSTGVVRDELVSYLKKSLVPTVRSFVEELASELEQNKTQILHVSQQIYSNLSSANRDAGYPLAYEKVLKSRTDGLIALEVELKEHQLRNTRLVEVTKEKDSVVEDLDYCVAGIHRILNTWESESATYINQIKRASDETGGPYDIFVEFDVPSRSLEQTRDKFIERGQDPEIAGILDSLTSAIPNCDSIKALVHGLVSNKARLRAKAGDPATILGELCSNLLKAPSYGCRYEGDRIGGVKPTTMTAGKRSLFALSVLLNVDPSPWPLLLDQPEDDLDSRSIYSTIAPFLREASLKRQIIMVTHNANLVVGADSDLVIAVNRASREFPNGPRNQVFDFQSGSLEGQEYKTKATSPYFLRSRSMEQHICDIVDGGAEAFRKRATRYRI